MKEGWEIKELQDCLSYIKNGANIKQTKGASGIPITRIETLSGGQFHRDKLGYADVFELGKFAPYVLDDADILMSHINSKAYIGRSVIYHKQDNEQIIHGMNLLRLKFFPAAINPEFANYYFKCDFFLGEVAKIRKDAVNQSSMAISDLKKISIPVPPLSEQQHIVEELDLLSSIIEKKKAQLNELDNLVQSLFYEMFGDPIINEKRWVIRRMSDIGEITTGNTPSRAIKEYYCDNYIEWIKTDNILKDSLYASEAKEYLSELGASHGRLVKKGAILVACIAGSVESIGKACITNRKVAFNQQINAITPNSDINVLFLYHLIKYMGAYIQEKATTGMKHILTKSMMETLKLPIPPIDLQNQFAERVQVIEHQKELIKKSVKEVETLFNSRMDYYFN